MVQAGLALLNGVLYGTTYQGGTYNAGTAFSIVPGGEEKKLYDFGAPGTNSQYPGFGSLVASQGVLYGTTIRSAGEPDGGTLYRLTPAGTLTDLHDFGTGSDGTSPYGSLTDVNGVLYGTADYGGTKYDGIVFSLQP